MGRGVLLLCTRREDNIRTWQPGWSPGWSGDRCVPGVGEGDDVVSDVQGAAAIVPITLDNVRGQQAGAALCVVDRTGPLPPRTGVMDNPGHTHPPQPQLVVSEDATQLTY